MRILVTGGAGFIGSEFLQQISSEPEVTSIVLDSLTYAGDLRNLEPRAESTSFHNIDIRNITKLEELFKETEFDAIVNFAAESHVDNSIKNPTIFAETNVIGTLNLLECARKFEVKRFLHISTDEVYGSVKEGFSTEETILNPSSPYAASKASAEHFVQSYLHTFNLPILVVRCSNNYGPRQYPEKLIPRFISLLMKNEQVPVYGDGSNIREWLYVADCVDAIIRVMHDGNVGGIYNVSSGIFRTNLEIARLLVQFLDKDPSLINFVEDRKGHDFRYAIDSSKIRAELGWQPTVSLAAGLESTVNWYLRNAERLGR